MDCIVRKLKASVNNANLPVFENVILKNYLTTTEDGQYIRFPFGSYTLNTKMDVVFEVVSTTPGYSMICSSMANCYIQQRLSYVQIYNATKVDDFSLTANTEHRAGFDTSNGSAYYDDTTGTGTPYSGANAVLKTLSIFGRANSYGDYSVAGNIKIKSVKITTHQTASDTGVEYNLVPAEINGVAGLYDAVRGDFYTEANGGTLVCG